MTTQPTEKVVASHGARLDATALAAGTISAVGLISLVVGRIAGARGFGPSDDDTSTLSGVCFFAFVLGLLIAVIAGAAAWWTGRRTGRPTGLTSWLVIGYLLVAIVTSALLNAA